MTKMVIRTLEKYLGMDGQVRRSLLTAAAAALLTVSVLLVLDVGVHLREMLTLMLGTAVAGAALTIVLTRLPGLRTRWLPRGVLPSIQAWTVGASVPAIYYLCTLATWRPYMEDWPLPHGLLYTGQLISMTHGELAMSSAYLAGEDFLHGGNSYAYFGLTPSLLRIPLLLSNWTMTHSVTPVYITAALCAAVWASLDLGRRVLQRVSGDAPQRWHIAAFVLFTVQFTIGGLLLVLTTPNFYNEAIAWGTAFTSLALLATWRWFESRHDRWLWLAVLWLVLGAGARPSAVGAALGLGALIVLVGLFRHRSRRVVAAGLSMVVLPLTYMYGVFWLKFRSFTIREEWQLGWAFNPDLWVSLNAAHPVVMSSPDYFLTNIVQYLRPDTVQFGGDELIDYRVPSHTPVLWMYPLKPGAEAVFGEGVSSITARMPLAFLLLVCSCVWLVRRVVLRWRARGAGTVPDGLDTWAMIGLLVAAGGATAPTLLLWALQDRYVGDAYPLLAAGTAFSFFWLNRYMRKGRTRKVVLGVGALVVAWSILINVGLAFPLAEAHWLGPTPVIWPPVIFHPE